MSIWVLLIMSLVSKISGSPCFLSSTRGFRRQRARFLIAEVVYFSFLSCQDTTFLYCSVIWNCIKEYKDSVEHAFVQWGYGCTEWLLANGRFISYLLYWWSRLGSDLLLVLVLTCHRTCHRHSYHQLPLNFMYRQRWTWIIDFATCKVLAKCERISSPPPTPPLNRDYQFRVKAFILRNSHTLTRAFLLTYLDLICYRNCQWFYVKVTNDHGLNRANLIYISRGEISSVFVWSRVPVLQFKVSETHFDKMETRQKAKYRSAVAKLS